MAGYPCQPGRPEKNKARRANAGPCGGHSCARALTGAAEKTALKIEQAIAEFEADGNEDGLLVDLQALNFTWNEIKAIIVSRGKRPRVVYYAAGDLTEGQISAKIASRRGHRGERLVIGMNV